MPRTQTGQVLDEAVDWFVSRLVLGVLAIGAFLAVVLALGWVADKIDGLNGYELKDCYAAIENEEGETVANVTYDLVASERSCPSFMDPVPEGATNIRRESLISSYSPPYVDQSETVAVLAAPPALPTPAAVERSVPGVFTIKVEQNDFDIPEDYTVKELRLTGSETLTLQGFVQAGTRCTNGLEVRVDVTNSGAPFTGATTTVTVAAGGTAEAVWDLQVSPDSYDAETMALNFEAVWLHGAC